MNVCKAASRTFVVLAVLVLSAGAAWAQVPGLDHAVTGATDQFLDKGIVGAVAIAAVIVAGLFGYGLYASMTARLKDRDASNKQFSELAERAIVGLEASKGAIDNSVRAIEEQGRANETRQATMQALTLGNAALEKAIDRALDNASRQGARS